MSDHLLSIHSKNQKVILSAGGYYMLIVGGFTIEENIFSVSIINVSSQKKINFGRSKRSWNTTIGWRTKAKYFYYFDIEQAGEYEVKFHNPESLVVYKSQLWSMRKLFGPIHNSDIKLAIVKNG
ncbi:hypothetical protein OAK35_01600 [Crocinitomicaceae bacterium]|nr:hypothetical protein [Crocinitomicaceae bacterium]